MLSVDEAIQRILARVQRTARTGVELSHAVGCVLAEPVVSRRALPPFSNSAMDGFAVRAAELPATLPIAGTIAAGAPPTAVLAPGTAQRIMTGAPVPDGADAVVIREDVTETDGRVELPAASPGQNIRRAGEDCAIGDEVLSPGTPLGPGEIGLCAALGIREIPVARNPSVALLSTGDELVDIDVEPSPGQIVNSNAYALAVQIVEAGGQPLQLGIAPDDREAVIARLRYGVEADVLLTSGGVSAGDFDLVRECFAEVGIEIDFWKVAIKPGKPLVFGVAQTGALVFGLPGNPVSSMVSFELFVRPAILAMQGARRIHRPRAPVRLASAYHKAPGRQHYIRARLTREGGELIAHAHAQQGSGMLRSMVGVDALVEVPAQSGDVPAGTVLTALLLRAV